MGGKRSPDNEDICTCRYHIEHALIGLLVFTELPVGLPFFHLESASPRVLYHNASVSRLVTQDTGCKG